MSLPPLNGEDGADAVDIVDLVAFDLSRVTEEARYASAISTFDSCYRHVVAARERLGLRLPR